MKGRKGEWKRKRVKKVKELASEMKAENLKRKGKNKR